jgi:hypothetical protein
MPWKPREPGEIPTLGFVAIDWLREMLAAPDHADYEPFEPYIEQEDFILRWYALYPSGKRRFNRGVFGRPRGHGKSPLLAALACFEAMGPARFGGWDATGRPVGEPWSRVRTPWVQIAAVADDQTKNTWEPVLQMLREEAPVHDHYDLWPMETAVVMANRGRIMPITSSARTVKGARSHFVVLDQTEEWVSSNGGIQFARTIRTNATKVGGTTLESPNAFTPGEDSVAERSAAFHDAIVDGRARDKGLLWDHREAPPDTDLTDYDSLIKGLRIAYGDSSGHPDGCVIHDPPCGPGHVDLDRIVAQIWDPTQEEQDSRTDFLNQITHAADQWITQPQWGAAMDLDKPTIGVDDAIVLGFDGSLGRIKGKADATALIGVRVNDGYAFEVHVWEAPMGPTGKDWLPNPLEVDREVRDCFERFNVVGFFADPSGWTEHIARWESAFRKKLKVKATREHPISYWPQRKNYKVVEAVEQCRVAIVTQELTHDGSPSLTRHVLNARKRETTSGTLIYKQYPRSPNKIDAAYALVMAWRARTQAIAAGVGKQRSRGRVIVG